MNIQQLQTYSQHYLESLLSEQEAIIRQHARTATERREQMEAIKLKRNIKEALHRKRFEGLRIHVLPVEGGMRMVWA